MPRIDQPQPDLELAMERRGFDYALRLPSAGLSPETGLILYVYGFAARYDDPYAKKLLPYLADTYDCIAVSVDYHDARSHLAAPHGAPAWPAEDFFVKLRQHHGITVSAPAGASFHAIFTPVMKALAAQGIERLHPECHFIKGVEGYVNFGLLPALDHLRVLHDVLRTHAVNKKRIFALGTSYGGYIALLMAKLAPNSFRLIIDNSGFSGPDDCPETIYGMSCYTDPVVIMTRCPFAFSRDPDSPFHFSDSRRAIRTVGVAGHYGLPSDTVLHSYHSATDTVAPIQAKRQTVQEIRRFRDHDLRLIGESDLDGRVFKTLEHGMKASMRGLFELSYQRWMADGHAAAAHTDFDLGTRHRLPCGDEDYVLTFGDDGVSLTIEPSDP